MGRQRFFTDDSDASYESGTAAAPVDASISAWSPPKSFSSSKESHGRSSSPCALTSDSMLSPWKRRTGKCVSAFLHELRPCTALHSTEDLRELPRLPSATHLSRSGTASSSRAWKVSTDGARMDEDFVSEPTRPDPHLAMEEQTAAVLEHIFPKFGSRTGDAHHEGKRHGTKKTLCQGPASASAPVLGSSAKQEVHQGRYKTTSSQQRLIQFRQKILDKFPGMKAAFESFSAEVGTSFEKGLTRKEFSRFLAKTFGSLSREEHDLIFDFLDIDKSGTISMQEFYTAIEAAAPVKNIEDLRRKWIALGFSSMHQAMRTMDLSKEPGRRYKVEEFGEALRRTGIVEDWEHQNVFAAVSDDGEKVSMEELAAGLAAVSPSLVLEDLRDKLLKKHGSLEAGFKFFDLAEAEIDQEGFRKAVKVLGLTGYEAQKGFRLIDFRNMGLITRAEFISAMQLSEPSLFFEEVRTKVRQRFRSMQAAIMTSTVTVEVEEDMRNQRQPSRIASSPAWNAGSPEKKLRPQTCTSKGGIIAASMEELHTSLASVQLSESDAHSLFVLMDLNKDGKVSFEEFTRAIRLFAPSCALEDMRLRCLQKATSISKAFQKVKNKQVLLDRCAFERLVQDLDYDAGVDLHSVYDIVEQRVNGGLTVGELVAALKCSVTGTQVPLKDEEVEAKAKELVRWHMAPFLKNAQELKQDVRVKPGKPGSEHAVQLIKILHAEHLLEEAKISPSKAQAQPAAELLPKESRRKLMRSLGIKASDVDVVEHEKARNWHGARSGISLNTDEFSVNACVRQSYTKISSLIKCANSATSASQNEKLDSGPILTKIHGYFAGAGEQLSDIASLVSHRPHSRLQHFKNSGRHYMALQGSREMMSKSGPVSVPL